MGNLHSQHDPQTFNQRELEILRLIKEGLSNHAIAEKLFLSLGTVKWYNRQIFSKLGVTSRTQAIEESIKLGLLEAGAVPSLTEIALQAGARSRHNLPILLTSFIGRRKEQADLRILLHTSTARLITILGPGGIGKTCLARRVAEEALPVFAQGAWLVDLSRLTDPNLVAQAVANVLDIRDAPGVPYEERLARYLRPRSLLLVLDNCEHLAESCARLVFFLLAGCPNLHILATSRAALGVEGEVKYPLLSLQFPKLQRLPGLGALKKYEAVQLFVERAGLAFPGFTLTLQNAPAIAKICRKLDGIPLALELAAARVNLLSVEQIAARLDDCFQVLVGGNRMAIPRHQTMRACLDWSFNLLSEPEQALLRRLAVFSGGWTLEAAETVCSDSFSGDRLDTDSTKDRPAGAKLEKTGILDLLDQLVNKSMVASSYGGPAASDYAFSLDIKQNPVTRFHLLEPIRQFAQVKLEQAGEVEALRDRHLSYFVELSERINPKPFEGQWSFEWKLLKFDIENIRDALSWALQDAGNARVEDGLRLAINNIWSEGGLDLEGHTWLEKALVLSAGRGPQFYFLRAKAFHYDGVLVRGLGDLQESKRLLEEGVAMLRECGKPWDLALALSDLAQWAKELDHEEALLAGEESVRLARQIGDPMLLGNALFSKGISNFSDGPDLSENLSNHLRAIPDFQESLEVFLHAGARGAACLPLISLSDIYLRKLDLAAAVSFIQEYLRYRTELEDRNVDFYGSRILVEISYQMRNFKQMEEHTQLLLDLALGQNNVDTISALRFLRISWKYQGDYRRASACIVESIPLCYETKGYGICSNIIGLAGIFLLLKQPVCAARLFGMVESVLKTSPLQLEPIDQEEFDRDVAIAREALTAGEFSQAWAEGQSLTTEEAIRESGALAAELAGSLSSGSGRF
jgi:predicted ATPase/DNA-binding CsgD family transcriptional regulator